MQKPAVRDAMLFLARLVVGVICIVHGLDSLFFRGMAETTGLISAHGAPVPTLLAWGMATGSLAVGAALIVGLLTTFVAAVAALALAVGGYLVYSGGDWMEQRTEIEYLAVVVTMLLMIVVFGSGRASIDGVLTRAEP